MKPPKNYRSENCIIMEGHSPISPDSSILSHQNSNNNNSDNVSTPETPISPGVSSINGTGSESHDTPEGDEQSSDVQEMFADEKLVTLSDTQMKHVKKIFSLFEIPKKKVIESTSLGSLLRCLNRNPTEEQVVMLTKEGIKRTEQNDSSSVPVINFDSFLRLYRLSWLKPCDRFRSIITAFQTFDPSNLGYISTTYFKDLIRRVGEPTLTNEEIEGFLREADTDGKIMYDEFATVMTSNMAILSSNTKKKKPAKSNNKKKSSAKK